MRLPEGIAVGVPLLSGAGATASHAEIGSDWADVPDFASVEHLRSDHVTLTMIAPRVITHRRTDSRYRQMADPPPEHAAVGHFERSRWTDEWWERADALARALDVQAAVLQTPPTFKATTEHATRLENFIAHAMRPGLALAWEWAPRSWPKARALALCEQIGAVPVIDPTQDEIPDGEFVYLRFRGGATGRTALRDDELKKAALAVRDRTGWVVFSNRDGEADARRFAQML